MPVFFKEFQPGITDFITCHFSHNHSWKFYLDRIPSSFNFKLKHYITKNYLYIQKEATLKTDLLEN